jgi:GxxExxY protein
MSTPPNREDLNRITSAIIKCAYHVSNTLGCGYLEKVYENALLHELQKAGLKTEQQKPIKVLYDGIVVGDYYADLVVEDIVIVELKVVKAIEDAHIAQCLNYLKATGLSICLLINFAHPRVEIKRLVNGPAT